MKSKLLYGILLFVLSISAYSQNSKKIVASCCEGEKGRCTGSAYCSACTNCSRCAHCKGGGTCGVCSSTEVYVPVKKKSHKSKKASGVTKYSNTVSTSDYYSGQVLTVITKTVNVRKGAGTGYEIIETLNSGEYVYFKEVSGEWALVEVQGSGNIGYVFLKYLN